MRVSRTISIYRAQRSQQGCSLSLGMLRLAEPPTGRARLRSSLKSPRNPITPIETSRVSTLHPGLYKGLREGARRVIGASDARELLPPPAGGPPPSRREVFGEGLRGTSKCLREGRRVIGATAKPLYGIGGKTGGFDRRENPVGGDGERERLPMAAGGNSFHRLRAGYALRWA